MIWFFKSRITTSNSQTSNYVVQRPTLNACHAIAFAKAGPTCFPWVLDFSSAVLSVVAWKAKSEAGRKVLAKADESWIHFTTFKLSNSQTFKLSNFQTTYSQSSIPILSLGTILAYKKCDKGSVRRNLFSREVHNGADHQLSHLRGAYFE